MSATPALRPLSFAEILDVALKVFGRHWRTLLACVLVPTVPIQIAGVLVVLAIAPEQLDLGAEPATELPQGTGSELAAVFGVQVLSLLASLLAWAACFKAVADGYLGREPSVAGSLRFGVRKIPRLFALGLVCGLLIVAGLLGLIVGALLVAALLILAVPALLFERIGVFAAIGRSVELVKGRYWGIVLMLLVTLVTLIVIAVVLGGLLGGIAAAAGGESETGGAIVAFIVNVASTAVTTPIFAAVVSILYVDQRMRREGFDPRQLAEGAGGSGAPHEPQAAQPAPSGWQPPSPPSPPSRPPGPPDGL